MCNSILWFCLYIINWIKLEYYYLIYPIDLLISEIVKLEFYENFWLSKSISDNSNRSHF